MIPLLFLDTETTGFKHNRLVQLAFESHPMGTRCAELFMPPVEIEEGASKVHGKTMESLAGRPAFSGSGIQSILEIMVRSHVVVCHNAQYDVKVLNNEGIFPQRHICTMKVAQRLLPTEPNHKLQGLRSSVGFDVPDEDLTAHDAMGDVMTMIGLFSYLFSIEESRGLSYPDIILKFEQISRGAAEFMPFGKYKGVAMKDLPEDYVAWMMQEKRDSWSDDIMAAIYEHFPQYKK